MKNKLTQVALTLVVAIGSSAFSTNDNETKEVDVKTSKITWKGYKVTGSHEGIIHLQKGSLSFDDNQLVGGEFIVDMTTIGSTDLSGENKENLDGHLKSDDFFGVEKHPTAKMVFTKVTPSGKNAYEITADLTIKSETHPVTFTLSVYGSKATGGVKIDRSKYNVRYGSGSFFDNLGDKTIYDEFDLVVDLNF
ncbi:YceI family protein [Sinomicrobium sp.]